MSIVTKHHRKLLYTCVTVFILMNFIAYQHARKFTQFSPTAAEKTKDPDELSLSEKVLTLLFGVDNPRPINSAMPPTQYSTLMVDSRGETECWHIPSRESKGTIILFHGYSGCKSSMIPKAELLGTMGYDCVLVDMMGSGGSAGVNTSIGYHEAEQVRDVYHHYSKTDDPILDGELYGGSGSNASRIGI